jgi:hypothetical protein
LQQGHQRGQFVTQLAPVDDHVDGALLEQEFGALKAFRQRLAHGLLDHARAGEADQRARFGNDDIAYEGETRGDAAHGRIGENSDEG